MSTQSMALSKDRPSALTTGLALFSMFFGAGNLIFPLLIGQSVGAGVWPAIGGLGVTAVLVPLLGLAAMLLFQGDTGRFFGKLGKWPGFALLLLLQLILGPMGVVPRLVALMHAMTEPYLSLPLFPFSLLAAAVLFFCSFRRAQLIRYLGAVLTPILLLSLGALFYFGLTTPAPLAPTAPSPFLDGLLGGYNTMDLIAAFLFATVVLPHFKSDPQPLKKMALSSLIAAALLLLTYIGLCLIARHGASLNSPPEQLLGAIARQLLGPFGGAIAALAVVTACLTTAITLSAIFADYLAPILRPTPALAVTLLCTTLFANLGFSGLAALLGPLLQIVYPGLILLTLLNLFGIQRVKVPVFATFALSAAYSLVS